MRQISSFVVDLYFYNKVRSIWASQSHKTSHIRYFWVISYDVLEITAHCLSTNTWSKFFLRHWSVGTQTWYSASSWNAISESLRYGTCSQGPHSFTCTVTRSSAIEICHTCLCLLSYNWYSFTDLWVGLGSWLRCLFTYHPATNRTQCRATALTENIALPLH